ncbi:MAG: hypothetical protein LBC80_02830 [Treponema sp.]|jgi:hypothetical protein|nr:hypothetical protein [Treponema sp.]
MRYVERRKGVFKRWVGNPLNWLFTVSFLVSSGSLVIYLLEWEFSDEKLYLILSVIWYSSFIVFVCSLYKLFKNIYVFFYLPKVTRALRILLFLAIIAYCVGIFFLETFILVISGGNE